MSHVSALLVLQEINEELMALVTPERVAAISSLHPELVYKGELYLEGAITPTEYLALVDAAASALLRRVSNAHLYEVTRCRMEALHDIPPHNNAQEISY